MNISFVRHFAVSATNVFDTMLNCPLEQTYLKYRGLTESPYEVSAVVSLTGKVTASVVLSLSEELALRVAGELMFDEFDSVTREVCDSVGELLNMVAGGAKMKLSELELGLGIPNVFVGIKSVFFPTEVKPISVGFDTQWGPMELLIGFAAEIEGDLTDVQLGTEAAV